MKLLSTPEKKILHFEDIFEVYTVFKNEMTRHMQKEEKNLFPACIALEESIQKKISLPVFSFGSIKNPIRHMEEEHHEFHKYLEKLQGLTRDFFYDETYSSTEIQFLQILQKISQDTKEHSQYENEVLHVYALQLLAS